LAQLNISIELLTDFDRVLTTPATLFAALADFLAGDISNDEDKEEEVAVVVSEEDNILRKAEFRLGRFDFTLHSTAAAVADQRKIAAISRYNDNDNSMHHLTYRW
jgi:hypothetical protein